MARKKIEPVTFVQPTYYLYFNPENGQIISVTNEEKSTNEYKKIIINYERYDRFVTGKDLFKDWVIAGGKDLVDIEDIVRKEDEQFYFKNNLYEIVREMQTADTELMVHWAKFEKQWIFIVSESLRKKYYRDKDSFPPEIVFYISYNNNLDQLLREIKFNPQDLILDKIVIPFESDLEYEINKLTVSTRRIFQSYSLSIWE